MGFGSGGEPFDVDGMWQGLQQGLLQGITSVGLNYINDILDIDPLIANMGFSVIATVLQAGLQAGLPEEYGGGEKDIFKYICDSYKNNALTFLGYADPSDPSYAWQQAVYISQILDFSNIVRERGLVDALNAYATGFFNSVAINAIVQSGYTIGQYFQMKLDQLPEEQIKADIGVINEQTGEEVAIGKFEKDADGNWIPIGKEEGGISGEGILGIDAQGKVGYTDGEFYEVVGDYLILQRIEDGQQVYMEIKDILTGEIMLRVTPGLGNMQNYYGPYGEYVDAEISGLDGYQFNLKLNDEISSTIMYNNDVDTLDLSSAVLYDLKTLYGISAEDTLNTNLVFEKINDSTYDIGLTFEGYNSYNETISLANPYDYQEIDGINDIGTRLSRADELYLWIVDDIEIRENRVLTTEERNILMGVIDKAIDNPAKVAVSSVIGKLTSTILKKLKVPGADIIKPFFDAVDYWFMDQDTGQRFSINLINETKDKIVEKLKEYNFLN